MNDYPTEWTMEDEINSDYDYQDERNYPEDEVSDLDQENPVDVSAEIWAAIYSDPDLDLDHDHSMDY